MRCARASSKASPADCCAWSCTRDSAGGTAATAAGASSETCGSSGLGYRYHHALDLPAQARIWSLREAALGLSMAMKGEAKSLSFVEDTAVAPEKLRDYIDKFLQLDRAPRHVGGRLRARVGRLPARPAGREPQDRRGRSEVRSDRQRGERPRARVRRRVVGRARRRPRAQPVHEEDVRPGPVRGVPRPSSARSIRRGSSIPARSSTRLR